MANRLQRTVWLLMIAMLAALCIGNVAWAATDIFCSMGLGNTSALATDTSNAPTISGLVNGDGCSIDRHGHLPSWLELSLNRPVHSLGLGSRNPRFAALGADLNLDMLKQVEVAFDQAVDRCLLGVQDAATDSAQGTFHGRFSLLVFGSSHFFGSNQWAVRI